MTVRVTENDEESFTILVLPRPTVQSFAVSGPDLVLTWTAIPNAKHRVQSKNNLNDPAWADLLPEVTAIGTTASKTDPLGPSQRFYRVLVLGQ